MNLRENSENKKKAIKKTLKMSLCIFFFLFILQVVLVKFIGPANVPIPGTGAKKIKEVSWKIVLDEIPLIILTSLGGAVFGFIVSIDYYIKKKVINILIPNLS